MISVDGDHGVVVLRPSQKEIDEFLERRRSLESRRGVFLQECHLPARTPDGATLEVGTNIESLRDFDTFDITQTDGVGLLRTEFLYMERSQFPSEEEQYRLYRLALERLDNRPATIRLLDIGGDKQLPYFQVPHETNPALGWRGIRITLQWRDLMRIQLRALLRASVAGDLRILLPMVTSLDEVYQIHQIFDEVRAELAAQGYQTDPEIPVGSMIEVPSLLLQLDPLAEAVDFLSVGTNDLVQYLLAVDRDNSWVSHLYDPHHPAVLAALERIAVAARKAGKPASVCGDAASDPLMAVLLLGLGYQALSVAPQFVAEIKYAVRRTRLEDARAFATELLGQRSASGVRAVMERMRKKLYDRADPPRAS
jgi:phosphotransferase system enzyme I (PtsI)